MKKTLFVTKLKVATLALLCSLNVWSQTDVTANYIVNPEPTENADGWTISEPVTQFNSGLRVAEFWNKPGASISQTISLPAGQYSLSVVAFTRTGMEAKLFAGDNYQTIVTVPSNEVNDLAQASLWFDEGHGGNELMFTMSTAGDVTIGLQADEDYGDHWMVWRYFRLNVFSSNVVTMNVTVSGGKVTFNDNIAINSSHTFFVQTGSDAVLTFTPDVGYRLTSVILNGTEDLTSQVVNDALTLSNVTSSTQLNVTFTKIVNAAELGDALITDVAQLSSPCMEYTEGSWDGMIDEDANTFWHSEWINGSVNPGSHYFQVEMPGKGFESICFKYVRRNVSNDHTILWSVYGTDNPDAEKEECTLITNVQTPFSNTTETLISPPFNPGSWTYFRFYSEEQYPNSRGFFHVAEFQLYTTTALTSWETAYLDLEKTYKQYYGSVFSVLSDQDAIDAFHSALQSSLMLLNDPDNVTEGELIASRENIIYAYQAALTSIQSVRQLEYETTVEGTTYSLYMQVEDMNDAKVNADGWAFYRSKLFLDITKDNQTNSYLIDDQLYMHIEVFDRLQTPMLFDQDSRQLYIFALSKDGDGSYSMAGYAYHTDLDNIEFEKEMVFNYANCGWWPSFIGVRAGQPVLSHFSFAGYYSMISYREDSGYWSNEYIPDNVQPDEYQRFWQQQEHVIVTGGNWVSDSQYEAALASIPDGAQFRIFTQHNGTAEGDIKYYLKEDGSLTTTASEAHLFTFNQIENDGLYLSPGWKLDVPFTNPLMSMANEVAGDIVPQGHIRVAPSLNRNDWEGQLWYKKGNRYAVRSTNSLSSMWGANTFWAALDNNADNLPEADYALAPAYVWQLEGGDIVVEPEPYAVLKDSILTFYYDDMKEARGGMSVGPFGAAEYRGWHNNVSSITRVVFKSSFANNTTLTSTASWFYGMTNLTTIEGIHYLNTSNVTNMRDMFSSCSSLTSLDVSGFNTQNVTDMYGMFYNCSGLTSLNLSNFNTSNVLNMQSMFNHCTSLTSLDLSSFDTHNVTDMSAMFTICWSLSSLDISSFNTQSVTNMESMFYGCGDLTSLDVSSFNTQIVTNMAHMFAGCSGLTSLDLSGFNTQNVMNMSQMFFSCYGLTTIYAGSDWSTGAVTDEGEYMFSGCTKLVGGNGTVYDENHQDASYAHIDGGPSNPGYFTERTGLFDGLVAYFPFNGDTKDASGYGNHVASQTGEITQVTGADGTANGAYHFDGGRMMVPNSKSLLFTDSCTFSAYVRATDYESTYGGAPQCVMAKSYDQVGLVLLEFEIHEDSIFSVMSAHGNNPTSEYIAPRNDRGLPGNFLGKWVHFAHVIKGDKAYFYTNGQLIYERSVSTPDLFNDVNQEDLYIGMNSVDWFGMRGDLDEVRIYNRALTETEIQDLAQYAEGPNEPETLAVNLITNGDLEGTDNSCYFYRHLPTSEEITNVPITDGVGKDDSRGLKVAATAKVSENWDNQFWFRLDKPVSDGTKFRFSFDYRADKEATVGVESHAEPGDFIYWDMFGEFKTFYTDWHHLDYEAVLSSDRSSDQKPMQSIAFVLSRFEEANNYYFDNIKFEVLLEDLCPKPTFTKNRNNLILDSPFDATIYYTTDGSEPTTSSSVYSTSLSFSQNVTVKAIAVVEGYDASPVATYSFEYKDYSEPYALLSENNTKLTFYYDDQKEARGGMSVGPFTNGSSRGWNNALESITYIVFDESFANCTTLTSTAYWFSGCSQLTTIQGIENLKTDNVTDMSAMFQDCLGLTSLNLSGFNMQNVTDMHDMFRGCSGLTSLNLSGFNTQNVTNMSCMFWLCSDLTSLDLSGFNTQNVTDMGSMFEYCYNLMNINLSGFNTQNVTSMGFMFRGCGLTSLDLSSFNTQNVIAMHNMFMDCSNLTTIYAGEEWTTTNVSSSDDMFSNCTNLVGGKGTVYDANHTDASYAHLDGGPSNPGYFTKLGSFGVTLTAQAHGLVASGDAQVRESSKVVYFDGASSMTLTITPDLGYLIDKVMLDGSTDLTSQVTNGALTVPVSAATTLTVSFKQDTSFALGDANADKDIDVADVVVTARHVVGNTPTRFVEWLADVTEDGDISVADMVGIVNIITGPESNETKSMWNADMANDVLSGTLTNDIVSISLDGASKYSAFQMALTLPDGVSADEVRVSTRAAQGHHLLTGTLADGRLMVLVYAADNSPLGISGEVLRVQLPTAVDTDLLADKIEFVTANGHVKKFAPLSISQPTSIEDMQNSPLSGTMFDVSGRPVYNSKRLRKGIYMINGKKTLVK